MKKLVFTVALCSVIANSVGAEQPTNRFKGVPVLDVPIIASGYVKRAADENRAKVAVEILREAVALRPQLAPTLVADLVKLDSRLAGELVLAAAELEPALLKAVVASATTVAPQETRAITSSLVKKFPKKTDDILVAASYRKSAEVASLGILGVADVNPSIFGSENAEVASGLASADNDVAVSLLRQFAFSQSQSVTLNISVANVNLAVVKAIVDAAVQATAEAIASEDSGINQEAAAASEVSQTGSFAAALNTLLEKIAAPSDGSGGSGSTSNFNIDVAAEIEELTTSLVEDVAVAAKKEEIKQEEIASGKTEEEAEAAAEEQVADVAEAVKEQAASTVTEIVESNPEVAEATQQAEQAVEAAQEVVEPVTVTVDIDTTQGRAYSSATGQ